MSHQKCDKAEYIFDVTTKTWRVQRETFGISRLGILEAAPIERVGRLESLGADKTKQK